MAYDKNQKKKKSENISEWYNDIVLRADLADYGPVKGTMVIKPYGYAIWEVVQKEMDRLIKQKGILNAYFPIFIPMSLLSKEKEHVKGFSPELAVVTHAGGEELAEPLAVRPTSETIMYEMYSKWVQSWRDLPVLINQWNNVVRWEKRTYLFLRTSEFLWQEGHTAHETHEEAMEYVDWAMDMYASIYRDLYALPGFVGRKSESEKFAGADVTLTYEAMMPDGKALQSCTSHDLGQNFSVPFNISFQNKKGEKGFAWQTSWGFSTRSLGGLILGHGDDKGLRLPPRLAPYQVVLLPVKSESLSQVEKCGEIKLALEKEDVRVFIDARADESMGFRINKWEEKGAPIRIEVGDKEISSNEYNLFRRDLCTKSVSRELVADVKKLLIEIQENMYKQAQEVMENLTSEVSDYTEFKKVMEEKRGFIKAFWCENPVCEAKIKEETKATTRCLPADEAGFRIKSGMTEKTRDDNDEGGKCVYCGKEANHKWIFAQAY